MKPLVAALLVLCPQLALAGGLRLAAELPEVPYSLVTKVSAERFVRVGVTWDRHENGRPKMPHYQLFDLQERQLADVAIPLHELPKAIAGVVGPHPAPDLVHHDGQVTSLVFAERKDFHAVATYFSQYDHRTKQFSELVLLGRWDDSRYFYALGFDPADAHFYYAFAVNPADNALQRGFTAFELARVDLKTRAIDWTMKLDFAKRDAPLKLSTTLFSPNGSKLALVEYNEQSTERAHPARPPQQALVVDIASKQVDAYPAPLTAYGVLFTRDDRYLLLGSHQLGEIVRIDLTKKRVDAKAKAKKLIHSFLPTPSGKSFLVVSNTQLASPKVIEVRRVADLKLQTSIPVRMLFPGNDAVAGYGISGQGGRILLVPFVDENGFSSKKGVRLYEVPDDVDSPEVAGAAGDVRAAQAVVLGKQYADARGIRYSVSKEDPTAAFAKVVVTRNGDVCLTGILSENTDDDYKPGRTRPVVARLDPKGKPRWQRVLVKEGFLDYEDGDVAATPDGGCVAHIRSYVHPSRAPVTRVVKLDAKGKVLWDHPFRGTGGSEAPIGDKFELLPDGSVSITGRSSADPKEAHAWKAVLDPNGKVVTDEVEP